MNCYTWFVPARPRGLTRTAHAFIAFVVLVASHAVAATELAAAPPRPDVRNILAPGQGQNLLSDPVQLPGSFTSQLQGYLALPYELNTLSEEGLDRFYKSAELDPAEPRRDRQ